ncbi:hypothetical protein V501_00440 [Pseudogymnoascus sp. VKM F-4519 (FW-2642)]|nr:hypothetical protein V501_00440 [Pseudogymnoascus sp. VKM F-4519 (FW-2642)]
MGRTDWNDDALRARYYDGLKDSIKDEIARGVRPDDLEKLILAATLIDNRHYERRLEKGGQKPTWIQKRPKQRSYWPQLMELDATFKQGNRPRNPNKERQLKERLCFNCNKPGHMARDCKQPKKGNGGRKYGKQINATWQGQLAATSKGKEVWEVTTQDLEEFDTSNGEDESDESTEGEVFTSSQERRISAFEESARKTLFKEQVAGAVEVYKETVLRNVTNEGIPVPRPPAMWQGTAQDWEVAVRKMRCRPGYPTQQEPRGANHTEQEAIGWLKYKLREYDVRDAIAEGKIIDIYHPNKEVYEDHQESLLQVLEQLELGDDYEGPQPVEIWAANSYRFDGATTDKEGDKLQTQDASRIDHPWHKFVPWSQCYTQECLQHYLEKTDHAHFPSGQRPVYYDWEAMKGILAKRRSTGQLKSKN